MTCDKYLSAINWHQLTSITVFKPKIKPKFSFEDKFYVDFVENS